MNSQTRFLIGLILCALLLGCGMKRKVISRPLTPPVEPAIGQATEIDIRNWAMYYLATGKAQYMEDAIKMARERFSPGEKTP